jgi:lipopolysaccharide biosynthesis glycosyltransferase
MVCHEKGTPSPVPLWKERFEKKGIFIPLIRGVEIDATEIRKCKSLFDSYATYFRLFAPDHAIGKKVIYSDTDILYFSEIEKLFQIWPEKSALSLIPGITCKERGVIEKDLLNKYGKGGDSIYFGAGFGVINVQEYRRQRISQRCMEVIMNDSASLKCHDQTVWNCAVGNINHILNIDIWAAYSRTESDLKGATGIAHFVGSPKPWDLFGEHFHQYSKMYLKEAKSSGLQIQLILKYLKMQNWKRAWRIRKQY